MSSSRYLRAYFPTVAAGGFSGTPGVSSKVLTGFVPVLTIAFKLSPAVASIVKTGKIPTLSVSSPSFSGTPGLASKVLTGLTPILVRSGGGGWDYKSKKKKRVIVGAKAYEVANADELNYLLARELASDTVSVAPATGRARAVTIPTVIALGPVNPANVAILTEQAVRLHQIDVLQALLDVQAIHGAHKAILADDADIEALLLAQHDVQIPFEALYSLLQALAPVKKPKIMPKVKPEPVKNATKPEHDGLTDTVSGLSDRVTALSQHINDASDRLHKALSDPLEVERGPDGRVVRLVQGK